MEKPKSPASDLAKRNFQADVFLQGGRISYFLLIPLVYSIYELLTRGFDTKLYLDTYLPFAGSLMSCFGTFCYCGAVTATGRGWGRTMATFAGLIPYLFGLYVFGFGLWRGWVGCSSGAIYTALAGAFWAFVAYKVLYHTWLLSEMGNNGSPAA